MRAWRQIRYVDRNVVKLRSLSWGYPKCWDVVSHLRVTFTLGEVQLHVFAEFFRFRLFVHMTTPLTP